MISNNYIRCWIMDTLKCQLSTIIKWQQWFNWNMCYWFYHGYSSDGKSCKYWNATLTEHHSNSWSINTLCGTNVIMMSCFKQPPEIVIQTNKHRLVEHNITQLSRDITYVLSMPVVMGDNLIHIITFNCIAL